MHNQDLYNLTPITSLSDWYRYFIKNIDSVLDSIGEAKTDQVLEALHEISKESGKTLMGVWGQVALWDKNDALSLLLINTGEKPLDPKYRRCLDEIEIDYLGTKIFKNTFIEKIPIDYKGKVLFLKRTDSSVITEYIDNGIKSLPKYEALYDVYNVNLSAQRPGEIFSVSQFENERNQKIPVFVNPNDWPPLIWNWLERVLIFGTEWSGSDNMPKMSGIAAFAISPGLRSDQELEKYLFDNRGLLLAMAWAVTFPAFIFQTYAISQASIKDPNRFREEIRETIWENILKKEVSENDSNINVYIEALINFNSPYIVKRVLREFPDNHKLFLIITPILVELLKSEDYNEIAIALQIAEVVYSKNDKNQELFAAVIDAASKIIIDLPQLKENVLQGIEIAFAALENAFCSQPENKKNREKIIGTIETFLINNDSIVNQNLERLLLATILFLSEKDPDYQEKLIEWVIELAYKCGKKEKYPPSLPCNLFMLLDKLTRQKLIQTLPDAMSDSAVIESFKERELEITEYEEFSEKIRDIDLISIVSGKGGVGKTLISLGISSYLLENPKNKICVIDLDLIGPTFNQIFRHSTSFEMNDHIYIDEYFWASYIKENDYDSRKDRIKELNFKNRGYWWKRYEQLSFLEYQELNKKLIIQPITDCEQLSVIFSSSNLQMQDLSFPFLETGRTEITAELITLIDWLKEKGYTHVIFDTPAEIKDLSISAQEITRRAGGKNIFVTTTFGPSLQQAIQLLSVPLTTFDSKNYLVINKVRKFDKKNYEKEGNFIDYLSKSRILHEYTEVSYLSRALGKFLLNVEGISIINWEEILEHFQSPPMPIESRSDLTKLHKLLREGLKPIFTKKKNNNKGNNE